MLGSIDEDCVDDAEAHGLWRGFARVCYKRSSKRCAEAKAADEGPKVGLPRSRLAVCAMCIGRSKSILSTVQQSSHAAALAAGRERQFGAGRRRPGRRSKILTIRCQVGR